MRTLLLVPLLLLAAPALAQEDGQEKAVVEAKADDAWVEARVRELLSDDPEKREAAMKALAGTDPEKVWETLARVIRSKEPAVGDLVFVAPRVKDTRVLVFDPRTGASEVIRGAANGYDYTLESLGGGRYRLDAKRGEDGEAISSEGTLKELQAQYPFLKKTLTLQLFADPAGVTELRGPRPGAAEWTAFPFAPDATHPVGLIVEPPPEALRFHLELPEGAGLIVDQVLPGSRAERLGLRRFDILLRLDGELIDSPRQLEKLHGSKGQLEIIRRGEPKHLPLSE